MRPSDTRSGDRARSDTPANRKAATTPDFEIVDQADTFGHALGKAQIDSEPVLSEPLAVKLGNMVEGAALDPRGDRDRRGRLRKEIPQREPADYRNSRSGGKTEQDYSTPPSHMYSPGSS